MFSISIKQREIVTEHSASPEFVSNSDSDFKEVQRVKIAFKNSNIIILKLLIEKKFD